MSTITITFEREEIKDLAAAISVWLSKKAAPSNYKHRRERLTQLRKEYSEQKNLDAVCLAANGGRLDLLSGRAGELREAIHTRERNTQYVEERIERMKTMREKLRGLLPIEENGDTTE